MQSYRSQPDLLTVHMYTCKFDILYYERWSIYQNGAHAVWKFDQNMLLLQIFLMNK